VSIVEEPIAASSIVPMYYVSQRARQDVKVALVGQGPDELFGGYTRHLGVQYGSSWRKLPGWLRGGIAAGIESLPRNEALKRGVYALGVQEHMKRYQHVFSIMPGAAVDGLFRDGALAADAGDSILGCWRDIEPEMEGLDELTAFQTLEVRSSLPDELLMYADKLSMAHGLEVRVPYLDKEVVDYAQRLPASFKIRLGQRKWLHRRVCERFLPPEVMTRKKRGFAVDAVDEWFHGSLNSKLAAYLLDHQSLMYEFLDPKAVGAMFEDHRRRRSDNHKMRSAWSCWRNGCAGPVRPPATAAACRQANPRSWRPRQRLRSVMALDYVLITPARNEADYIELTIRSVIAQTHRPKRWVIVSDGSTDATDAIVER
jgi:asparagine synthase (glutamine-hydrolysing)